MCYSYTYSSTVLSGHDSLVTIIIYCHLYIVVFLRVGNHFSMSLCKVEDWDVSSGGHGNSYQAFTAIQPRPCEDSKFWLLQDFSKTWYVNGGYEPGEGGAMCGRNFPAFLCIIVRDTFCILMQFTSLFVKYVKLKWNKNFLKRHHKGYIFSNSVLFYLNNGPV